MVFWVLIRLWLGLPTLVNEGRLGKFGGVAISGASKGSGAMVMSGYLSDLLG